MISRQQFERVTKEPDFPESLSASVKNGQLEYFCNSLVSYTVKGVHAKLNVIWDWEPPAGSGDTHFAFYRGTRSRVEVRQAHEPGFRRRVQVVEGSLDELARPETVALFETQGRSLQVRVGDEVTIYAITGQGTHNTVDLRVAAGERLPSVV